MSDISKTVFPFGNNGLTVSIAIPIIGGKRSFRLRHDAPRFPVVVLNVSNKPQKIWAEDCSAGNGNLTVEIRSLDGETFTPPLLVQRRTAMWRRNCIRGVTLEPGDSVVREIALYEYQTGERSAGLPWMFSDHTAYVGFPRLGETTTPHELQMRAVFEIVPSTRTEGENIWTGRIVSQWRDYTVWGRYV